jgi:kynurenine formamidase
MRTGRRLASAALAALAAIGISSSARAAEPAPPSLASARVVDLTYAFDEKTIYWPTSPSAFELKSLARGTVPGGWFYASNAFCTPEHGGTHLDAPIHFSESGRATDQIPPRQLIAAAAVIDVRKQAAAEPDYRLSVSDVRDWEMRHGTIAPGTIVLLRTGWGSRWPNRKAYLGDDTPGDASKLHFPSYGSEAARLLVHERRVGALGVDTASIDPGASKDFPVHRIANGANVPGLENIASLEQLPESGAWVIALPMKIAGGSGGPLRIVALLP